MTTFTTGCYTTSYQYDWQGRQVQSRGPDGVATKRTLDGQGRATTVEAYADADADFVIDSGELRGKSESAYDEQGRLWKSIRYEVISGTAGNKLTRTFWYDSRGQQIKSKDPNGLFSKTAYDSLGRAIASYVCYDSAESSYADVATVSGDTIIEQTVHSYSAAGLPSLTTRYQRTDSTSKTGDLSSSWAASDSRRTFIAHWYDVLDRPTTSADYGTNGESGLSDYDPATAGNQSYTDTPPAPNSHDNVIVAKVEYDANGNAYRTTDNFGKIAYREFDCLGRTVKVVENYVNGTATETETDTDRVTETKYDSSGRLSELWAYNPKGSGNGLEIQKTKYLYGNTVNSTAPVSNGWVSNVIYPDSSDTDGTGSDQVKTSYDYLGRKLTMTEQRGVTHTYSYDSFGRFQYDSVGTGSLPSGVNGDVRKIGRTYDDLSRVQKVSSYDSSNAIVNEAKFTYGSYGQVSKSEQNHSGAVGTGTPAVDYGYSDGASSGEAKYVRLTSVTYPGPGTRRAVYSNYSSSGVGSVLSRLDHFADDSSGTTKYALYTYLGAGTIVRVEHPAVTNGLTLSYGTGGTYSGLDRFGRIIDQKWTNSAGTTTFDEYQYGYDRGGNRVYKQNAVGSAKDEFYSYDGLQRLGQVKRGTLNGGKTDISGTPVKQQTWGLESLGNWNSFVTAASGTTDLSQTRTHDAANEMTATSNSVGTAWATVSHDAAGNMSGGPKGDDPTVRIYSYYDGWNRLSEVKADSSGSPGASIATYAYDGLNRRIKKSLNGGDTFDYFWNESWELLETRKNGDGDPLEQYAWDRRYIDAPVMRWRDSNTDGTVDDTLYVIQDANLNVTAIVGTSGTVQERYAFDPYGKRMVLDATWGIRSSSDYDWSLGHQGLMIDTETGLIYNCSRMYHATIGAFLQRDPSGYVDGLNLYEYESGGPIWNSDVYGLESRRNPTTRPSTGPDAADPTSRPIQIVPRIQPPSAQVPLFQEGDKKPSRWIIQVPNRKPGQPSAVVRLELKVIKYDADNRKELGPYPGVEVTYSRFPEELDLVDVNYKYMRIQGVRQPADTTDENGVIVLEVTANGSDCGFTRYQIEAHAGGYMDRTAVEFMVVPAGAKRP